ncbi:hypothetical protein HMPREF2533_02441 [Bacteroides fragilis]|nr:hypothetical protein HMPREF2530_02441 [Bacteroides fragilis]KXU45510.1 hypothetical protein HMPREF2533_02441 [Bacteroides fragilis]
MYYKQLCFYLILGLLFKRISPDRTVLIFRYLYLWSLEEIIFLFY